MTPIFSSGLFEQKTALITGGATGIGLAIARLLGALGAKVVIASRNADRLAAAAEELGSQGISADWHVVNIRKEGEVVQLFDALEQCGILPDILVNNAGGQFSAPAMKISANGFRSVIDLNLVGTWHTSLTFAKQRIAHGGGGRILNIVLSIESGSPGYAHAGAARAGVINLTKTLAIELASSGLTVNSIAPGIIATSSLERYGAAVMTKAIERLPIKRMGQPYEVAQLVAFLASPAGDYITGACLTIDGGKQLSPYVT